MNQPVGNTLSDDLKAAGVVDTVKLLTFPIEENKFFARLTNLDDLYDSAEINARKVDLDKVGKAIYKSATNGGDCTVIIREMSLGANMEISELKKRKIHWKTVDDNGLGEMTVPIPSNMNEISLSQQMIRVFEMTITPAGSESFMQ